MWTQQDANDMQDFGFTSSGDVQPAASSGGFLSGVGGFLSSLVQPAATLGSAYLTNQAQGKVATANATTATSMSKTMMYVIGGVVAVIVLIGAVLMFRRK